jgi:hypothetical protein
MSELILRFGFREADRLRRYATGSSGGFQAIAARVYSKMTRVGATDDYEAIVDEWRDISRWARQRATRSDGGWQGLLRAMACELRTEGDSSVVGWPAVRDAIRQIDRQRDGEQLGLLPSPAPTCDDGFGEEAV